MDSRSWIIFKEFIAKTRFSSLCGHQPQKMYSYNTVSSLWFFFNFSKNYSHRKLDCFSEICLSLKFWKLLLKFWKITDLKNPDSLSNLIVCLVILINQRVLWHQYLSYASFNLSFQYYFPFLLQLWLFSEMIFVNWDFVNSI